MTCQKLFIFPRIFKQHLRGIFAPKFWWICRFSITDMTFSLILKGFNIGHWNWTAF